MPSPSAGAESAIHRDRRVEAQGLALGLLGVAIFALTVPMTRLAVGDVGAPQLPPLFVTAGRAALAGVLSIAYLAVTRAAPPGRAHLGELAVCALGTVVGFPLFLALALRHVEAVHAAVVTGLLPLATAIAAAIAFRQRPSAAFWLCAGVGAALVVAFAVQRGGGRLDAADALLLAAMASAAIGYVAGAKLAAEMSSERVICWVLVASLPLSLPAAIATWPTHPASGIAWAAFAYVTVFSMWLGFFAWYRGLVLGGAVRVSQVQLVQPFIAMLAAIPLVGERLDGATVAYSMAVVATVMVGRRTSVGQPRAADAASR